MLELCSTKAAEGVPSECCTRPIPTLEEAAQGRVQAGGPLEGRRLLWAVAVEGAPHAQELLPGEGPPPHLHGVGPPPAFRPLEDGVFAVEPEGGCLAGS